MPPTTGAAEDAAAVAAFPNPAAPNPAVAPRAFDIAIINGDIMKLAGYIPNSAIDNNDDAGRSENTSETVLNSGPSGSMMGGVTGGNQG